MVRKIFKWLFIGLFSLVILSALSIALFMKLSPQFGASPSGEHLERIRKSKHFGEDQFVNLIPTSMNMGFKEGIKTMGEFLSGGKKRSPEKPLPTHFSAKSSIQEDSIVQITWYGHSAIGLDIDGLHILIDPMLGKSASPVPFMTQRFDYTNPINIENIQKVDAVILSHDHYDHLDYPSIMKLKDKVVHFYTPLGVGSHLKSWGVAQEKITELDWWESTMVQGVEVTAAPARHFSGRGLTDRNKTQWASWVIRGKSEKIYFSGDSGYGPHFQEIGEKYGPFDFAMMECGQYNEKWEAIHMMPEQTIQASMDVRAKRMMPEQTIQASQDVRAKRMMPIHWSAFNLALHSWTDPVERAVKAANIHNVNIITPVIGKQFSPSAKNIDSYSWWENF